jgi:ABC-type transport system involved in multi-copper enzyme maturation permease subunit
MKLAAIFSQNPIITQSLRNRRTNWRVMAALGLAVLAYCPACLIISPYTIGGIYLGTGDFFLENLDEVGTVVFNATAILLFLLVTLFAPTMSAGAIAGERQRQTFDLLRVTLLPTRFIVVGKLVSALIYTLLLIAAVWPVILFSLLTGGIGLIELFVTVLLLAVTSVAFTTIGLFVSSIGRTITNATMLTYGVALPALFIAPPLTMLTVTILLNFANAGYRLESLVNFYGWGLVLSLNPIGAAIYSAVLYAQNDQILLASLNFGQQTYYLLAPWFIYIIFYSVISWFLVQLTGQRLARMNE